MLCSCMLVELEGAVSPCGAAGGAICTSTTLRAVTTGWPIETAREAPGRGDRVHVRSARTGVPTTAVPAPAVAAAGGVSRPSPLPSPLRLRQTLSGFARHFLEHATRATG